MFDAPAIHNARWTEPPRQIEIGEDFVGLVPSMLDVDKVGFEHILRGRAMIKGYYPETVMSRPDAFVAAPRGWPEMNDGYLIDRFPIRQ